MTEIMIKRVHESEDRSDGFHVQVDKLWSRGTRKESLHYDLWVKEAAPSTFLRRWYHEDMEGRWQDFERKYTEELNYLSFIKSFIAQITKERTVTLLYASKNTELHIPKVCLCTEKTRIPILKYVWNLCGILTGDSDILAVDIINLSRRDVIKTGIQGKYDRI